MSYKITIEETKDVRKLIGKQWVKIGEKIHEGSPHYDGGKPWKGDEMGYAPEVETVRTETTKVYEQVVESLDLKAVIQAINT